MSELSLSHGWMAGCMASLVGGSLHRVLPLQFKEPAGEDAALLASSSLWRWLGTWAHRSLQAVSLPCHQTGEGVAPAVIGVCLSSCIRRTWATPVEFAQCWLPAAVRLASRA